jgi:adenosine deaminase
MFENNTSDLHCHLNGSFSLRFLRETAEKNGCLETYLELEGIRAEYLSKTAKQPELGYTKEHIELVWRQFSLIHKIIKNLADIHLGTIDVIRSSSAKYLEIRTTPKKLGDHSVDNYIDAFEQGLISASQDSSIGKKAYGLLSLDRTMHDFETAKYFINRIATSHEAVLKGIDICGHPTAARTLRGEDLSLTIKEALNRKIGLAIHMGEADTDMEREDTDTILATLEQWLSENPTAQENPFFGKVRLGHCIFLTDSQKEKIRRLKLPIEVCPTCHSKLNWHLENTHHPVRSIYSDLSEPITFATDDEIIFGANSKVEFNKGFLFFANSQNLTRKEVKENQAQFRFA